MIAHPDHKDDGTCKTCLEKAKNEMAQMFKTVVLRMKLAIKHKQEFVFAREAGDITDRVHLWPQWMDLIMYQDGYTFEDVDGYR